MGLDVITFQQLEDETSENCHPFLQEKRK